MTVFWIIFGAGSQMGLWMAFSRFHYRHWEWEKTTYEVDRKGAAGLWGFLWPLLIIGYGFWGLFTVVGWAQTTPSLGERKKKKRKEKQEKLKDLNRQVKAAEHELRAATEQMKKASE
jgi:hypothetical protein